MQPIEPVEIFMDMTKIVTLVLFTLSLSGIASEVLQIELLKADGSTWKELSLTTFRCLKVDNNISVKAGTDRELLQFHWHQQADEKTILPSEKNASLTFTDAMDWNWKPLGNQESFVSSCNITSNTSESRGELISVHCKNLMVVNDDYPAKNHLKFEFELSRCE